MKNQIKKSIISIMIVLVCIAKLNLIITIVSADNVEPASVVLHDTNGNGIFDIDDNKTFTFWANGTWTMEAMIPNAGSGQVAQKIQNPAGKVIFNITDRDLKNATGDDPVNWHKRSAHKEILNISISSHDPDNGTTWFNETASLNWNNTLETWQYNIYPTFNHTFSGKREVPLQIPEFPTIVLSVTAVIGMVVLLMTRSKRKK